MIVIVAGLPGSGKSYFAEHLAEKLDATYINSDHTRLSLRAAGKYSYTERLNVYKAMLTQTAQLLEENRNVLVDATFFHHTMREMFVRLAQGYNVPIRFIEIVADEQVIRERLKKPRRYSEANYTVYEQVRNEFEPIVMPHLTLESTNDNLESMLHSAVDYISHAGV
jgi:predicted kinase